MVPNNPLRKLLDAFGNIGEINLVLNLLKEEPLYRWVLNSCLLNKAGISSRIPLPGILIDTSIELGLVETKIYQKGDLISLTNNGRRLLSLSSIWQDRLSEKQGEYIFSQLLRQQELFKAIFLLLSKFNVVSDSGMWLDANDRRIDSENSWLLRTFQQIHLAEYLQGKIIITEQKRAWLNDTSILGGTLDIDTLFKIMNQRRKNGAIAEKFVVAYEKRRLKSYGRVDLSQLVKNISLENVAAGYDILSYNGKNSRGKHDRFIEVKGTMADEIIFFITKNELETARKLGSKYWIYFVTNVANKELKKVKARLQNPSQLFFNSDDFELEPVLWKVGLKSKKA